MLHFAKFMHINVDGTENDRQSLFALIDNAFLKMKNKNIFDS